LVRTVAFLRSLDLDPIEILARDAVAAAEAWVPTPRLQPARVTVATQLGFAAS
jgi:hypothetical protein